MAGDLRRPLWLLFTAALVVLLAGCANVAVLLLARTASRRRELAIRLAVGATRFQILRQLTIESLLLGALGGVCGLAVAAGAVSLLERLAIPGKDMLALVSLDRRLMLYGLGLSLSSGLLFGIAPALHMLRQSQSAALVRSVRRRFQNVFVTAQVAAAFVLLVATGLLLRSLWAVEQVHPGFDPAGLTTAYMLPPRNDPGFLDRLEANLRGMPGVESAALALPVPFDGGAGSVGPLGVRLEPLGKTGLDEAREAFAEQIRVLADGGPEGGVDLLILETMPALNEARVALEAAHSVAPTCPCW